MDNLQRTSEQPGISKTLEERIGNSADVSWRIFGKRIVFYLPGMFTINGEQGKYPAISVTGAECELHCKHCRGKLLKPMFPVRTSDELLSLAEKWKSAGVKGILLSGGSTKDGFVPHFPLLSLLPKLKEMGFFISAHSGFATRKLAKALADAGVDQVLIDVVGDDETMRDVLNIRDGIKVLKDSLDALFSAKLVVVPHIIIGLKGKISGEYKALEILKDYPFDIISYVVLMPAVAIGKRVKPIPVNQAIEIIVTGRELFPGIEHSLGCARPRGKYRRDIEKWALRAGINRMALWSEESIEEAKKLELEIVFKKTCCSVL